MDEILRNIIVSVITFILGNIIWKFISEDRRGLKCKRGMSSSIKYQLYVLVMYIPLFSALIVVVFWIILSVMSYVFSWFPDVFSFLYEATFIIHVSNTVAYFLIAVIIKKIDNKCKIIIVKKKCSYKIQIILLYGPLIFGILWGILVATNYDNRIGDIMLVLYIIFELLSLGYLEDRGNCKYKYVSVKTVDGQLFSNIKLENISQSGGWVIIREYGNKKSDELRIRYKDICQTYFKEKLID